MWFRRFRGVFIATSVATVPATVLGCRGEEIGSGDGSACKASRSTDAACTDASRVSAASDGGVDASSPHDSGGNDGTLGDTGMDAADARGNMTTQDAGDTSDGGCGVLVSPEITMPSLRPGYARHLPVAAFDGTNYLLAWQEGPPPGTAWELKATRVSASGVVLDNPPFTVSTGGTTAAAAGFDGTNFVLAWEVAGGVSRGRVSPSGVVLNPGGIVLDSNGASPTVGCSSGECLIAWNHNHGNEILASRVSPSGSLLDASPIVLAVAGDAGLPGEVGAPQVDFDGMSFFVAWLHEAGSTDFRWTKVAADSGVVLDTGGPISTQPGFGTAPSIAFDGTNHVIAWPEFSSTYVQEYQTRLAGDGSVLNPNGSPLAPSATNQTFQAVDFDGHQVVAIWDDTLGPTASLRGVRVFADGSVDSTPFVVAGPITVPDGGGNEPFLPRLASDGHASSLVAYVLCGGGTDCSVHARLLASCAAVPDAGGGSIGDAGIESGGDTGAVTDAAEAAPPTEGGSDGSPTADAADGAPPIEAGGLGAACGAISNSGVPCVRTPCDPGLECYMTSCGPIGVAGGACLRPDLNYFIDPACSGSVAPCVEGMLPSADGGPATYIGTWCLPAIPGQGPTGCGM